MHRSTRIAQTNVKNFAKFLVLNSGTPGKFLIHAAVLSCPKGSWTASWTCLQDKNMGIGDLLVVVDSKEQYQKLTDLSIITEHKVSVSSPSTLSSAKGVVSELDLLEVSHEEIAKKASIAKGLWEPNASPCVMTVNSLQQSTLSWNWTSLRSLSM